MTDEPNLEEIAERWDREFFVPTPGAIDALIRSWRKRGEVLEEARPFVMAYARTLDREFNNLGPQACCGRIDAAIGRPKPTYTDFGGLPERHQPTTIKPDDSVNDPNWG